MTPGVKYFGCVRELLWCDFIPVVTHLVVVYAVFNACFVAPGTYNVLRFHSMCTTSTMASCGPELTFLLERSPFLLMSASAILHLPITILMFYPLNIADYMLLVSYRSHRPLFNTTGPQFCLPACCSLRPPPPLLHPVFLSHHAQTVGQVRYRQNTG